MELTTTDGEFWNDLGHNYCVRFSKLVEKYYACVRVDRHGHKWEFAWEARPYRTFDAAVKACERNQRYWHALIRLEEKLETTRGRKTRAAIREKIKALKARGRRNNGSNISNFRPAWA